MSRDIHRIIGTTLADEQLGELLDLKQASALSLARFFQSRAKVQLKKGQSAQVVQALDRARGSAAQTLSRAPLPTPVADSDLPALATSEARAFARVIDAIAREVHFDQVNRDLRLPCYGGDYEIRPFPLPASPVDKQEMKVRLRNAAKASRNSDEAVLARRIQQAFSFFMFGEALSAAALTELFGLHRAAILDDGFRLGLFITAEGRSIRMNGLSLFSKQLAGGHAIHVFADTPPHFETRTGEPRVYIGADSYELMERVSERPAISGYCVEMGSGSGVQLVAALKQFPAITKAIGQERDRRALNVSLFNAALNSVDDRMAVVNDDDGLRQMLEGHRISFAMTNPPFIAMPRWIDVDPDDRAFFSRLTDVRETDRGIEADLRAIFPPAGWGGEDGLAVTRRFIDALFPLLALDGEVIVYSQFGGGPDGPVVLEDYIQSRGGFRLAFEAVTSRTLTGRTRLSAGEAAASVARLIVAALMARDAPRRRRLSLRKDGREHALMMRCARRLEDSYRRQGITHFHDGFGVLTHARGTRKGAMT